jgi:hypothetical protein
MLLLERGTSISSVLKPVSNQSAGVSAKSVDEILVGSIAPVNWPMTAKHGGFQ